MELRAATRLVASDIMGEATKLCTVIKKYFPKGQGRPITYTKELETYRFEGSNGRATVDINKKGDELRVTTVTGLRCDGSGKTATEVLTGLCGEVEFSMKDLDIKDLDIKDPTDKQLYKEMAMFLKFLNKTKL